MKHGADKVVDKLVKNRISAAAIHGNKSQNARQRAIQDFTNDRIRVLVATDIASRGIDIEGITHVINLELPHVSEDYVHRIGRTARAGTEGSAISLCDPDEKTLLYAIEKLTRQKIRVITDQPFHSVEAEKAPVVSLGKAKARIEGRAPGSPQGRGGHRNSGGGGGGGGRN